MVRSYQQCSARHPSLDRLLLPTRSGHRPVQSPWATSARGRRRASDSQIRSFADPHMSLECHTVAMCSMPMMPISTKSRSMRDASLTSEGGNPRRSWVLREGQGVQTPMSACLAVAHFTSRAPGDAHVSFVGIDLRSDGIYHNPYQMCQP